MAIFGPIHHRLLMAVSLFITGCASVDPRAGFDEISADVEQRIGHRPHWHTVSDDDDAQFKQSIRALLAQPLSVDSAIQIGLLNSPALQSSYADLGISQADLAQAGMLNNPLLEFTRLKPRDVAGGDAALDIELRFEFLDILLTPMKRAIAAQDFAAAKKRITAQILDHAAAIRKAIYDAQAAQQMEALALAAVRATEAALETANRLRTIGNITAGEQYRFALSHNESVLAFEEAKMATRASREVINQLLGLSGECRRLADGRHADGSFACGNLESNLKPIPLEPINVDDIERRVLDSNLGLAELDRNLVALGKKAGIDNVQSYLNDLEAGYAWERESEGEWHDGLSVEVSLPIFDTGHARRARSAAMMQKMLAERRAAIINLRATARQLAHRLTTSRGIVERYVDSILPLRLKLKNEELLNYNAMQIDVFALLRAHQQRVMNKQGFVQALHNYWLAHADLETLLSGAAVSIAPMTRSDAMMSGGNEGEH